MFGFGSPVPRKRKRTKLIKINDCELIWNYSYYTQTYTHFRRREISIIKTWNIVGEREREKTWVPKTKQKPIHSQYFLARSAIDEYVYNQLKLIIGFSLPLKCVIMITSFQLGFSMQIGFWHRRARAREENKSVYGLLCSHNPISRTDYTEFGSFTLLSQFARTLGSSSVQWQIHCRTAWRRNVCHFSNANLMWADSAKCLYFLHI